jgi:hypothetical protein
MEVNMRSPSEIVIVLGLLIAILLISTRIATTVEQDKLTDRITSLLQLKRGSIADFVEVLGEPKTVAAITCAGVKCTRAVWDLSLPTRPCWRRVVVVINEEEKTVFMAFMENLIYAGWGAKGVICAAVPS